MRTRAAQLLDSWAREGIFVSDYGNHAGDGSLLSVDEWRQQRAQRFDGMFNWDTVGALIAAPHVMTVNNRAAAAAAAAAAHGRVHSCTRGAQRWRRQSSRVSSYTLKHDAETQFRRYVANGELILARALLRMPVRFPCADGVRSVNAVCYDVVVQQ